MFDGMHSDVSITVLWCLAHTQGLGRMDGLIVSGAKKPCISVVL